MAKRPLIESRSIDYVPQSERHGKVWHLWPVWFMGDAHLATIATGVVGVNLGGNLFWMTIAVLLGTALGTFFMAFHSTQGPQLGLPQMIQSRPQFGYVGALLVWCVALVTYVGYNAFNQVMTADAMTALHIPMPRIVAISGIGIIAATLAAVGHDTIHLAQRILAATLLIALAIMTFAVGNAHFGPEQLDPSRFTLVPFLVQLFASAAYQLSWSIYVSDYSRYLPKNVGVGASFAWTYVGAFIGGVWTMLVGTVAAAMFPKMDLAPSLLQAANQLLPGSGAPFLIVSLLGLVTITTLNFYGASLTLLSVADTVKPLKSTATKRVLSLVVCLIVSNLIAINASDNFAHSFEGFLGILLYLFTPWTAINLVDFYVVRKGHYSVREIFNPRGMYGRWNWRGLVSYFVGFVSMIPFFSTGIYTGPVAHALGGADLAMLVGLPVSALIYMWAYRGVDFEDEARRAAAADEGLDAVA